MLSFNAQVLPSSCKSILPFIHIFLLFCSRSQAVATDGDRDLVQLLARNLRHNFKALCAHSASQAGLEAAAGQLGAAAGLDTAAVQQSGAGLITPSQPRAAVLGWGEPVAGLGMQPGQHADVVTLADCVYGGWG